MRRKTPLMPLKELNEISNTPLIDLAMLLLVTFLITYPLLEQGISVNLPQADAEELDPGRTRTITLDVEGNVFLDDTPVSLPALSEQMLQLGKADPTITVFVRADKDLKYGRIVDILKILYQARISRTALVTQAE